MKTLVWILLFFPLAVDAQEAPGYVYKPFAKKTMKHFAKIKAAAEKGDTAAMAELGFTYYNWSIPGSSVQNWLVDNRKAAEWYARGITAGHVQRCAFLMGQLYTDGDFRNRDSAMYYFQLAADRGCVPAMLAMAKSYWAKDIHALFWYGMAAKGGSLEAAQWVADINTAADSCFYRAVAAAKRDDYKEALRLWKIDSRVNLTRESSFNVGRCYENGYGVPKDRQEATSWYERACDVGMGEACYRAGLLDQSASYLPSARKSFEKAVRLGYRSAQADIDAMDRQAAMNEAEKKAFMDGYTKKLNDAANNPVHTVIYTPTASPATNYNVPGQTSAQRDQDMYDRMHKEQAERERAYKAKWGN